MKLRKLASIFVLGALLMTGCQAGGTTGKSEDVAKEKTVVAATVSGSQVLDKLDANVVGIPTTQLEMPEKFKGLPEVGQSMNPDLEVVDVGRITPVYGDITADMLSVQFVEKILLLIKNRNYTLIFENNTEQETEVKDELAAEPVSVE